jgi:hypothetical protein
VLGVGVGARGWGFRLWLGDWAGGWGLGLGLEVGLRVGGWGPFQPFTIIGVATGSFINKFHR